MENYSKNIRQIRELHNMTQKELSKATGIPQQTISWSENEQKNKKKNLSIDFCVKLADYYRITIDELIGRDFIPNNYTNEK